MKTELTKQQNEQYEEQRLLKAIKYANSHGEGFKPFKMSPAMWLALDRLYKQNQIANRVANRNSAAPERFNGYWITG